MENKEINGDNKTNQTCQDHPKETLISWIWRKTHKTDPPYYCYYSIWTIVKKPIRKWFSAVVIPTIPFSDFRVTHHMNVW